ncbi:MAG: hypothetical protein U5K30_16110 [Acidimicrobiales bacterium]|nr:hypothetical protein [Acidimicrobiales bacterium]
MSSDDPDDASALGAATPEEVEAATQRVIERLLDLVEELDPTERPVLANLLSPTIELAATVDDVVGFDAAAGPGSGAIAAAVRRSGVRVTDDPRPRGG